MIATQRRVHRLRLRAPDDAAVRHGALLLEDALRVAALQPGRTLVVRSLHLGAVPHHAPSSRLALQIEERLRPLAAAAVHISHPSARWAPAVYFHGELEPICALSARVARGKPVDEWFWRPSVPDWQPGLSRPAALRRLLQAALQSRMGPAAAPHLLSALAEARALAPLLEALTPADGPSLLRAMALTPIAADVPPVSLSARWPQVSEYCRRWGPTDDRSRWLVAAALAADQPARLVTGALLAQADTWLRSYTARLEPRFDQATDPELSVVGRGDERPSVDGVFSSAAPQSLRPELSPDKPDGRGDPLWSPPWPYDLGGRENQGHDMARKRGAGGWRENDHKGSPLPVPEMDAAFKNHAARPFSSAEPVPAAGEQAVPEPAIEGDVTHSPTQPAIPASVRAREDESPLPPFENLPAGSMTFANEVLPTEYAGLYYLLAAMNRLGMGEMLAANPALAEIDLPQRILRRVAAQCDAPAGDPVLLPLDPLPPNHNLERYCVPDRWLELCRPGPLRLQSGEAGLRVLSDTSGRLPLAAWSSRIPLPMHAPIRERGLVRVHRPMSGAPLELLETACLLALPRWCRRFTGLGLCDIICRSGHITWTRTHLDLIFELRQVDIRIRRAGLDIDPGWVPWLGRVVTFHYSGED